MQAFAPVWALEPRRASAEDVGWSRPLAKAFVPAEADCVWSIAPPPSHRLPVTRIHLHIAFLRSVRPHPAGCPHPQPQPPFSRHPQPSGIPVPAGLCAYPCRRGYDRPQASHAQPFRLMPSLSIIPSSSPFKSASLASLLSYRQLAERKPYRPVRDSSRSAAQLARSMLYPYASIAA